MAKVAKSKKVNGLAYANFSSELRQIFNEQIILKEHCRELTDIDQVYQVHHDRQNDKIVLSMVEENIPVGARYEVDKVAKKLAKKYKVPIEFD